MGASDDVIHQPIRLRVMAALTACDPSGEGLDFTQLKKLTGATDGNLGAHLDHLARAGLRPGDQGLCRPKAPHHGQSQRARARGVPSPCGLPEVDH